MFGMRWRVRGLGALFVLGVLTGSAWGQLPESSGFGGEGLPRFVRGVYAFAGQGDAMEARLVHQIFYDALQFEATGETFTANYELAVQVQEEGEEDEVVTTRVIRRRVEVNFFDETNSITDFDVAEQRISLAPGKYIFYMALTDASTKKTARDRFEVTIPNLRERVMDVSSLVFGFLQSADSTGAKVWRPYAGDVVPEKTDTLRLRFEIYNRKGDGPVPVKWRLTGRDKFKREGEFLQTLSDSTTQVDFPLSLMGVPASSYSLQVEVGRERGKVKVERTLVMHQEGLSYVIADLDEAIDMLVHIAKGKEIKNMKKGNVEAKKQAFLEFWKQLDPTPSTSENETMDEYYRRAYYCKKAFGRYRPGWQTDRGRIYILLGPPDSVDRYPFESNADPTEVWYYGRYDRDFVFVDENGYGEYRLLTEHYDIIK